MNAPRRRVAVIGSGISGLGAAWHLSEEADVTLFEAGRHFGGHANTVDMTLPGPNGPITHGVDTGFLVYNERTYPQLIALFEQLQVPVAKSDMSFSVQAPAVGLEWSGSDLNTVFAQRSNLLRPRFWGMLSDIVRFNRLTTALAEAGEDAALAQPIADFLKEHRFGTLFTDGYLLPMIGCIWSSPTDQMLKFPIGTLIRFCHNHGLLQVANRPQWYTVEGGSRNYVQRMLPRIHDARLMCPVHAVRRQPPDSGESGVLIDSPRGTERFDEVVLACHTNQSLSLLADATAAERAVLGGIKYQANRAVLHTDTAVLPKRPLAWAAWNYERAPDQARESSAVCLHYLLNRLQPLPWQTPVVVSLNPVREIDPAKVHAVIDYDHPVFDLAAVAAQQRLPEIQGHSHVWFCGAWTRYGFHEDGLMSGRAVADALRARWANAPAERESA
ncbi:NAD(P)/FAD-dependent oxidoreductase [Ideonella margarita]|uniref:FAD-dependent oxidoreductase n=1 Tax=Ideonella margarita TaxID=2984191 RepID=A0ABU9C5X6_9BURK